MAEGKNKLIGSMFWSLTQNFVSLGIGLIVSTVIARMLVPEAYGVVAAANIFISLANTFVSGGFGNALIQRNADDKDCSTMFIFNTVFSLTMYGVIFFSAPVLVTFFNNSFDRDLLISVIRTLGIGIVLSSFNSFYRALLQKQLMFKKLFKFTLAGSLISGAVGIIMAYQNFGVWALIAQTLLSYLFNTVIFVRNCKWRPQLYFSFKRFFPMFSYGVKMMLTSFLISIYAETTSMVIGNQYTAEDLACHQKGITFPKTLSVNIVNSICTVLFPVLATMRDAVAIKHIVRKFNRISAFVVTPVMFGFAAVGSAFIELLLTDTWIAAVPFLQICCFTYAVQPIAMSSLQYLRSSGRATEYLVLDVIRKAIGIILIIVAVALKKGVILIAVSDLVSNILAIFVNMYPGKKHIGYGITEQIWDVLPKFFLSGAMFIIVSLVGMLPLALPLLLKMFMQITVGVIVYVFGAWLFRMRELGEMMEIIRRLLKRDTPKTKNL